MPTVHQLSRTDARRIAVRAQLLSKDRPTHLLDVVRHLTMLQLDPTNAVAPSADLVAWSRLGSAYSPDELRDAVDEQRLIDLHGYARPADDIALYRAEMAEWPGTGELLDWQEGRRDWLDDNNACRLDILDRLRSDGPLPVSALPDTCVRPWASSGWNNNKNVPMLLGLLVQRGEVASAGREGRHRLYDLASRVYPDDPPVPTEDAVRIRNERRLAALGIARATSQKMPGEPNDVGLVGEPAEVEGTPGQWRVDAVQLGRLGQSFAGRAALLSPLDRLVYDRKRMEEIFEFDYQLEMYKPAAKRRWGYWALPILHNERLVGKLDATAERREWVLRVDAVHEDVPFPKAMRAAVDHEIEELAGWLDLEVVRV